MVTTIEVYKFHALINRNKENNAMELQCYTSKAIFQSYTSKLQWDSFKLSKYILLTFLGEMNSRGYRL